MPSLKDYYRAWKTPSLTLTPYGYFVYFKSCLTDEQIKILFYSDLIKVLTNLGDDDKIKAEQIKKKDEMLKKAEDDRRQREPVDPRKLVDRQEVYFSELGIQRNGISHMICTYGDGSKIKAKFIRDHYHNGCPASK